MHPELEIYEVLAHIFASRAINKGKSIKSAMVKLSFPTRRSVISRRVLMDGADSCNDIKSYTPAFHRNVTLKQFKAELGNFLSG